MPQQPEKQIPWWLAIDLGVILVSLAIIAVVIWMAPWPRQPARMHLVLAWS
jgi:hypothetical protein